MKLLNYFIDVTILGDNLNFLRKGKTNNNLHLEEDRNLSFAPVDCF